LDRTAPASASRPPGGPDPTGSVSGVPWWLEPPRALGAGVIDMWKAGLFLWSVFIRTLYYTFRGKREKGDVWKYALEMGNRSMFFITVTMGFVGVLFVQGAAYQVNKVTGDLQLVGAAYIEFVVRELAASVGAVVLATRIGSGIAAEIGSMVVTDQVDAMRMCGTDPVEYLVSPRFIASLVTGTSVLVYAGLVTILTGMASAYIYFQVNPRIFFNLTYVDWHEVLTGLVKCVVYCATIPVVSAYCGLSTFGGSEGVGWATTRAVVNSAIAIIMLDAIISTSAYFIFY
jgi:phospholipid/cholesterol/gamma-HCH transport system permease protein